MIIVDNVHKHFGGFKAVDGTTLEIKKNSITGLIGPNGAGKTTLFNVIAGDYKPTSGKVFLDKDGNFDKEAMTKFMDKVYIENVWCFSKDKTRDIFKHTRTATLEAFFG